MRAFLNASLLAATLAAAVSVIAAMTGFGAVAGLADGGRPSPEAERFVLSLYRGIDAGEYDRIAPLIAEGAWSKGAKPREYHFAGLTELNDLKKELLADYGENGWQIRFVSLDIAGSRRIRPGEALGPEMRREEEILRHIEKIRGRTFPVEIVSLAGHVTGRCTIVDWTRQVPVVDTGDGRMALSRGAPEDYALIRREQWFTPVKF